VAVADRYRTFGSLKEAGSFSSWQQALTLDCRPEAGNTESRSSVWLEHYTDNVGVSSSNLLGTTIKAKG